MPSIKISLFVSKISEKINNSQDKELNEMVNQTISRINESEKSLVSLYKLRQLEQGL